MKEAVDLARHCSAARVVRTLLGFALHSAGTRARRCGVRRGDRGDAAEGPVRMDEQRLMLDEDGRSAYGQMNCEERLAANKKIWWMSTPMFSDSADGPPQRGLRAQGVDPDCTRR